MLDVCDKGFPKDLLEEQPIQLEMGEVGNVKETGSQLHYILLAGGRADRSEGTINDEEGNTVNPSNLRKETGKMTPTECPKG